MFFTDRPAISQESDEELVLMNESRCTLSGYSKKDAARDTNSGSRETSRAHHDARTDSGVREGKDSGNFETAPDWAESKGSSGVDRFPDGRGPSKP